MENNKERVSIETQTDFIVEQMQIDETNTINLDISSTTTKKEKFIEKLKSKLNYLKIVIINNLMLILILISAGLGIGVSLLLKSYTILSYDAKIYFAFPGELFVRALKFISLPLVFFNLITGMSGLVKKTKKIGSYALMFYSLSLSSSVLVGFLISLTIQPGYRRSGNINNIFKNENLFTQKSTISQTILDVFRNLIPGKL
jgi:Na+/H+-dicarboxylate symporter